MNPWTIWMNWICSLCAANPYDMTGMRSISEIWEEQVRIAWQENLR